jgi:hypothetical protein
MQCCQMGWAWRKVFNFSTVRSIPDVAAVITTRLAQTALHTRRAVCIMARQQSAASKNKEKS